MILATFAFLCLTRTSDFPYTLEYDKVRDRSTGRMTLVGVENDAKDDNVTLSIYLNWNGERPGRRIDYVNVTTISFGKDWKYPTVDRVSVLAGGKRFSQKAIRTGSLKDGLLVETIGFSLEAEDFALMAKSADTALAIGRNTFTLTEQDREILKLASKMLDDPKLLTDPDRVNRWLDRIKAGGTADHDPEAKHDPLRAAADDYAKAYRMRGKMKDRATARLWIFNTVKKLAADHNLTTDQVRSAVAEHYPEIANR